MPDLRACVENRHKIEDDDPLQLFQIYSKQSVSNFFRNLLGFTRMKILRLLYTIFFVRRLQATMGPLILDPFMRFSLIILFGSSLFHSGLNLFMLSFHRDSCTIPIDIQTRMCLFVVSLGYEC